MKNAKLFCLVAVFFNVNAQALMIDDMLPGSDGHGSWVPHSTNGDVAASQATPLSDGSTLRFACDFSQLPSDGSFQRCYWDKTYSNVDLRSGNAIKIHLSIDNPSPVNGFTTYLQLPSSNGVAAWYYWGKSVQSGAQDFILPYSQISADDANKPLGSFSALSTIRLSPGRAKSGSGITNFDIASIEAITVPIAFISGGGSDYDTKITSILDRYDILYAKISPSQLVKGVQDPLNPLAGTSLIITNNNPLTVDQANNIADYISASGAKFIDFGPQALFQDGTATPKGRLADVLGINLTADWPQVSNITGISFNASDASAWGLPQIIPMSYSSVWPEHYTSSGSAQPTTPLAYWLANGTVSATPALYGNSLTMYFDKYLVPNYHPLDDDHFVLAMMMKLSPTLASTIVNNIFNHFGQYNSFSTADTDITAKLGTIVSGSSKAAAQQSLAGAESDYASAQNATSTFDQLNFLLSARKKLTDAYSLVAHSKQDSEVRALWVHSGVGPYPGDWAQSMQKAKNYGFTHVAVNVARGANVVYPSQYSCGSFSDLSTSNFCFEKDSEWQSTLSAHPQSADLADPLASAVSEAHKQGLKFYAWKVDFSWSFSTDPYWSWWKNNSGIAEKDAAGNVLNGPSPCSQTARDMDFNVLSEVANHYNVDGLQLDYIRFLDGTASYDDSCKTGFSTYLINSGMSSLATQCLATWPSSSYSGATGNTAACVSAFKAYRVDVITQHVQRIRQMVDQVNALVVSGKPRIELSADVFPGADSADSVGQDWPAWTTATNKLLDRAFPMTYAATLIDFQNSVRTAANRVKNASGTGTAIPLHYGLGGYLTTPDGIIAQIDWLRNSFELGNQGFSFFNYTSDASDNMLSIIAKSIAILDTDGDGVRDEIDNCPTVANSNQADFNHNGIGEVCEHGLTGMYYSKNNFTSPAITRVDSTINFSWGNSSPGSGVGSDNFSVRWTGKVLPPVTGTYQFCATADDNAKVWVNSVKIIDKSWGEQCSSVTLTQNKAVTLQMDYVEYYLTATAILQWSYPGQAKQVIPASQLYAQ